MAKIFAQQYSFLVAIFLLFGIGLGIELPVGLRPAKALGEPQRTIVPGGTETNNENGSSLKPPPNVRTPPNLSLRSRMIAALNSEPSPNELLPITSASNDDGSSTENGSSIADAQKPPVIFAKSGKKARKTSPTPQLAIVVSEGSNSETSSVVPRKSTRITVPPPPQGKNYGVNTLLQTNLIDSKGRVLKGVNVVPIRVPPGSSELRNAKSSRASASQVEIDAEKVVPIKFGQN